MPDMAHIESLLPTFFDAEDQSKLLNLTFSNVKVSPGQYIPKNEAQNPPNINFSSAVAGEKYIVVCLDIDAPFPAWRALSPALHWIQASLSLSLQNSSSSSETTLTTTTPPLVDYAPPGPPPWSAPHRYVFLLYKQPVDFATERFAPPDGGKVGVRKRIRFDLGGFKKQAGLGEVVAGNWVLSN